MKLDDDMKNKILKSTKPLIVSAAAGALVAGVTAGIMSLVATNYKSSTLTGDKEIHPTSDETAISKSEVAASEKEGKLSADKVSAQNGEVGASNTEAAAAEGEAKAADSGASALRTKAGAADIATKGLNMT
ncbi:MAG: hypothetical protein LBD07_03620 [Spirochaetaceae bacterium]|jgi:hypothetical protein|nr:hypothetical protein [Spirochaetaceae bacterium]